MSGVEVDLHLLELRFEALRSKSASKVRRLMASLAEFGQHPGVGFCPASHRPRRFFVGLAFRALLPSPARTVTLAKAYYLQRVNGFVV